MTSAAAQIRVIITCYITLRRLRVIYFFSCPVPAHDIINLAPLRKFEKPLICRNYVSIASQFTCD